MGKTVRLACGCGFVKTLNLGGGLLSNREADFLPRFTEKELLPYFEAKGSGLLEYASSENCPGYCGQCADLIQAPALRLKVRGASETWIAAACAGCGGPVELLRAPLSCPRCGAMLQEETMGLWD